MPKYRHNGGHSPLTLGQARRAELGRSTHLCRCGFWQCAPVGATLPKRPVDPRPMSTAATPIDAHAGEASRAIEAAGCARGRARDLKGRAARTSGARQWGSGRRKNDPAHPLLRSDAGRSDSVGSLRRAAYAEAVGPAPRRRAGDRWRTPRTGPRRQTAPRHRFGSRPRADRAAINHLGARGRALGGRGDAGRAQVARPQDRVGPDARARQLPRRRAGPLAPAQDDARRAAVEWRR